MDSLFRPSCFSGNFRISGGHPSSATSHCDTHLSGEIFGPHVFEAAGLSSQQVRLEAMNIDRFIHIIYHLYAHIIYLYFLVEYIYVYVDNSPFRCAIVFLVVCHRRISWMESSQTEPGPKKTIHSGRLTWNLNHPFRKENDLPNLHDYVLCQSPGVD